MWRWFLPPKLKRLSQSFNWWIFLQRCLEEWARPTELVFSLSLSAASERLGPQASVLFDFH